MKADKFNKNFFPTPKDLIRKMISKIEGYPKSILEPQAGRGDIVEALLDKYKHNHRPDIATIEKDINLQAILKDKGFNLIDQDFLAYFGPDKFDLIISNPPFDNGADHLLKAIDVMYRGQIICLLNAETLRNPFSNIRKLLVRRLEELNAEIEYHDDAFIDAERTTAVSIALVNIFIDGDIEKDLFSDCGDTTQECTETIKEKYEISTKNHIEDIVNEYKETVQIATDTILSYYKNYKKISYYITLNSGDSRSRTASDLTGLVQDEMNSVLKKIRKHFWRKSLELNEIKSRLTEKRRKDFEDGLAKNDSMDFTENNIRSFILSLIHGYNDTLTTGIIEIFDNMSIKYAWDEELHNKNVHYFNGWKTNNAFKINKKVIMPVHASYGNAFFDGWSGKWKLDYSVKQKFHDIDIVMNYFDAKKEFLSINDAIEEAFKNGQNSRIESEYFFITVYKKGTVHLTFKSDDILRRFNIAACLGKNWLPQDYGNKKYNDMLADEKKVVLAFESEKEYKNHTGQLIIQKSFSEQNLLM